MSSTINFGIDLGTSNSLIARFDKGNVEVYKNPNGFKETLPSIVGFRNDRILIGDQARTYLQRDPKSVASRFKRKMGTSETFKIKALNASKTPVELSSYILKELKAFVHSGEQVESAVITIPASFDTVQSNATKEAGKLAGFKDVVLLQEPIAASLAYANKEKNIDLKNSQWLVYDLGGGTFDVALVRIVEGELTVLDHEGDNYLGGTDIDALIVEKIVVPELQRRGSFSDLLAEMKSESGKYNKLWHTLLLLAESAKVELSSKTSAEIDLGTISDLEDDDGKSIEAIINITRSEFDAVIKDSIESTIDRMRQILTRNSLQSTDLKFILMVGGSTFIPYVRKRVEEVMGIAVNTSIDPTNAICVGAAYFAGTKEKGNSAESKVKTNSLIKIRASYTKASQEKEETFTAKIEGEITGYQYRITNDDGSYDSGLKKLSSRIVEDLPLREGAFNLFTLKVYDSEGDNVPIDLDVIQIAQGRYSVAGQMLPEDISLVKDDIAAKDTRLQQIFSKNTVLPSKARGTVEVGQTVVKGSQNSIKIMVVEGPSNRHSSTNKPIGVLQITGEQITRDLLKGTDIDLTFEMSESRDLTVSAFLNGTGQEFSQVFNPAQRDVSSQMLATEILLLETKIQSEIDDAQKNGNRDTAEGLEKVLDGVQSLIGSAAELAEDDVTDKKFQLEDKKRKLAQEMFELTSSKRLDQVKAEYHSKKTEVAALVNESGNDRERHTIAEIMAREQTFINSTSPEKIQAVVQELGRLEWQILMRTPDFLKAMFQHLLERRTSMNDQIQASQLIDSGRRAVAQDDIDELRKINGRLWDLMPATVKASDDMRAFTGIV
ncbi:Chaperone protein DnaK [Curvibacter sp. AEP1-3]|uniref:Hsp70 family protein n=1 Tax=Curvibacter sp. AEP1-3 TaxID=1844971 RepID=UPI000B3C3849|nr:Hsp70 family protein [Curvibacter sp. AEP1-3]ARV17814.1 Chaperone protein DnaK [Curvibacter sp. AEP1-3]